MRIFTIATSGLLSLAGSAAYAQVYTLDPTFGTAGKAIITFPSSAATDVARTLRLQSNGAIVVAGRNNDLFGLARLTPTGQPDATFGTAGTITTAFAPPLGASPTIAISFAQAEALVLQPDGSIVAAGRLGSNGPAYRSYARYLPTGVLDNSFGTSGKLVPYNSEGSLGSYVTGLQQQADGKLLSIGWQMGLSGSTASPVYRLSPNGTADATYSWSYPSAGPNSNAVTNDKVVSASAVDAEGRLLTAGGHFVFNQNYSGPQGPALVRYTSTGQPDPGFGTDGLVVLPRAEGGDGLEWKKMALLPDGKIVVASLKARYIGTLQKTDSVTVACYNSNGTLNAAFGRRGLATASFNDATAANGQALTGFHVLPSGDMVLAVQTTNNTLNMMQLSANGKAITTPSVIAVPGLQLADMVGQPDGRVVFVGTQTDVTTVPNNKRFAVLRLAPIALLSTRGPISSAQVQLYPNPAAQNMTLSLTGAVEGQPLKLQVFDVLGREVLAQAARPVAGEVQIALPNLRPGSYTLRVQGTGFTATRQFLRTE